MFLVFFFFPVFCQEAELAREKTNDCNLDKSRIFAVNLFDDFENYMKVLEGWTPAEINPYTPGVSFSRTTLFFKFILRIGRL